MPSGSSSRLQPPPSPGVTPFNESSAHKLVTGNQTPTRKDSKATHIMDTKRKQTLLSLLDILHELQKEGDSPLNELQNQMNTEKLEEPTEVADEQLQKLGAESFFKFQKRLNNLDRELRNFANATRQLGSSVGILSSAFHLRERIVQLLFLFRDNAADLFRHVRRQTQEQLVDQKIRTEDSSASPGKRKKKPPKRLPHVARPLLPKDKTLDLEDFPEQLEEFAKDIKTFLKSLNEFPEFTDEAVNNSMNAFEADLKYWASCLKTYDGQFHSPAVQRYVHDLCGEMGDHLDTITSSLSMFLEIGIPTIRFAQRHAAENLLNLSTVATFFSAVTATTLQFSFDSTGTPLEDAVNSFWFISLVFSIASAVNSLLGLTWKQAMYRSPRHRVPWWVLIWIKRSPLIFLVFSVAAFSVGLCVFAYSSHQSKVTSGLTTIFTCFSSFGLVAVSAWFIFERWTFSKHLGKKWLMDVLSESSLRFARSPPIRWLLFTPHRHLRRTKVIASTFLLRLSSALSNMGSRVCSKSETLSEDDIEKGREITAPSGTIAEPTVTRADPGATHKASSSAERLSSSILLNNAKGFESTPASPTTPANPASASAVSLSIAPSETAASTESNNQTGVASKRRFASIVRNVITANRALGLHSPSSPLNGSQRMARAMSSSGKEHEELVVASSARVSRVASLIPALKSLQPTQLFQPHTALVRHLQFSPNGEFLATCSWDRTCLIFKVKDFTQPHRILAHPQGFVGQVAWSPDGEMLLTRMIQGIKLWTAETGVCRRTIQRHRSVRSVAWYPQSDAFLSVEESEVMKLDLNGNLLQAFTFDRMDLHDVAITSDSSRMLCVATLTASPDGLKPSMSREEKQIIVYNLDRADIETQVPILHEVRDITLAKDSNVALVSYENKAPPQLWELVSVKDRTNETTNSIVRLSLAHTYMPKSPVDFAGPSYFGGKDDQLVLCAGKAGDMHIWDRRSGYMLHSFQAQDLENNLTCIAWNHAASPFMFASGSHDGTVQIWTSMSNTLPPRNSYIDLRQSGANTPQTITPELPLLLPAFTLEVIGSPDREESAKEELLTVIESSTPSPRSSTDGRLRPTTPTPQAPNP